MYGLGRKVEHDPRSRMFAAPRVAKARVVSRIWHHDAPVLNQGELGSCTGNALAQLVNTVKFGRSRARARKHPGWLNQEDAIRFYSRATQLDIWDGEYPPDDTGSSGLAVTKAGVEEGFFERYDHAFGFEHFLQVMMRQPVIVGTNWYDRMFYPDNGIVTVDGTAVGGHEYLALGVDMRSQLVVCLNSWGPTWGRFGRFYVPFAGFDRLLREYGDVTVPIPL